MTADIQTLITQANAEPDAVQVRLAALLNAIEHARYRLLLSGASGIGTLKQCGLIVEELGKIVDAKNAYDAAVGDAA